MPHPQGWAYEFLVNGTLDELTAVFAPTPRAFVSTATAVKPGDFYK